MSELELHPLSPAAELAVTIGCIAPYFYNYSDSRWWFTDAGREWWLFDDELGIRIVENPF